MGRVLCNVASRLGLFLLWAACGDEAAPGPAGGSDLDGDTLQIALSSVSPQTLVASDDAQDDVVVTLRYRDPSGELGEGRAEVFDCRDGNLVNKIDLPPIASSQAVDEGVTIFGQLKLHIADVGMLDKLGTVPALCEGKVAEVTKERLRFCLQLRNAAGDVSNSVCTDTIPIAP